MRPAVVSCRLGSDGGKHESFDALRPYRTYPWAAPQRVGRVCKVPWFFLIFSSTLSWFCLNRKALGWGSFLVLAPFYCALARVLGSAKRQISVWLPLGVRGEGAGAGISSATARRAIAELQWLYGSLKDRKLRGSCQCGHGGKGIL